MEKAQSFQPLARKEKLVTEQMADELLVYDLETHKAHCLNLTSAIVWQYCNGKNNISQIAKLASKDLQASVSEEVVILALNQLEKNHLLTKKENIKFILQNVSRRDLMKRIGIASAIALPISSTMVAPTALAAVSCPCSSDVDCVSGGCAVSCNIPLGRCV